MNENTTSDSALAQTNLSEPIPKISPPAAATQVIAAEGNPSQTMAVFDIETVDIEAINGNGGATPSWPGGPGRPGASDTIPGLSRLAFFRRTRTQSWPRFMAFLLDLPGISIVAAGISAATGLASIDAVFGPALVAMLATVLYHTASEASPLQCSPGKFFLGMKTVRLDGGRINVLMALYRSLVRLMNWTLLGLPNALCMLNGQRAMVHDMVTRTRTIRTADLAPGELLGLGGPRYIEDMAWGLGNKIAAGTLCVVLALVLSAFAFVIQTTGVIRAAVTDGYNNVVPTLAALKSYYEKNGVFPARLSDVGQDISIKSEYLAEVTYVPNKGVLLLTFSSNLGLIGKLFVAPVSNAADANGQIVWMCGSTTGFLQSYLPKGCPSQGQLALRQLSENARKKESSK